MIKKLLGLVAVIALSGCAVNYTFEGQKYESKEKFLQGVDDLYARTLMSISPSAKPITQKKLIFAIPSEATIIDESKRRYTKQQGTPPVGQALEILESIPKSNYKGLKVFFDALQKKNLYASVQLIEMQSMTGSIAASADADVLYMIEPSQNAGQWYYTSLKNGKQIFAYDKSGSTLDAKLQAFIEAVQLQAIRD